MGGLCVWTGCIYEIGTLENVVWLCGYTQCQGNEHLRTFTRIVMANVLHIILVHIAIECTYIVLHFQTFHMFGYVALANKIDRETDRDRGRQRDREI